MHIAEEFGTGWGICDLVGCEFDQARVAYRTEQGQRQPLGSAVAIRVYSVLPDADKTSRGISIETLRNRLGPYIDEDRVERTLTRLVETNHARRTRSGCFQKVNGWAPLATRLVAVELKLHRWSDALCQAKSNLAFAPESFVALPLSDARRAASGLYGDELRRHGIGLLGVCSTRCEMLVEAQRSDRHLDEALALWATEYFWRIYRGKH
jgi:hypothetical protein